MKSAQSIKHRLYVCCIQTFGSVFSVKSVQSFPDPVSVKHSQSLFENVLQQDYDQLFPMRNPEKLLQQLKGITSILLRKQLFDLNEARQSTIHNILQ